MRTLVDNELVAVDVHAKLDDKKRQSAKAAQNLPASNGPT
jgi:hypothetical protein